MKIIIPGRPITKKNNQRILRKHVNGKSIPFIAPSEKFIKYQNDCFETLIKYRNNTLSGKYNVKCLYFMPTRGKVDLLNLMSATLDILVHYKILEDDNSKIVLSHDGSRVLYDKKNPRVEIYIDEIEP